MRLRVAAALLFGLLVQGPTSAWPADDYVVVHDWPTLPQGEMLGQAVGVGIDSKGDVLVLHRAGREWREPMPLDPIERDTVAMFDGRTGRMVRSWGKGLFAMPHGLTVDDRDNVWITDVALQQVFKFSLEGRLLMVLGVRGIAGADRSHFNRPTDVAVLADGGFYVSDGYLNTRVMRFAPDGTFLFQWGTPGSGPGQFDTPHALALDAAGRVYVADRGNARVQVFDARGNFLAEWKDERLGRPYSVALAPGGRAVVVDGGDQPEQPPDRSGAALVDLQGRVLGLFGRFGNRDGQFQLAHDVAVARDGSIYVVDAWGRRVQKFLAAGPDPDPGDIWP